LSYEEVFIKSGTWQQPRGAVVRTSVDDIADIYGSEWAAMSKVAELLGVGTSETVRKWCRQAEVDAGRRPGLTTEEPAELKRSKRA
jgi:transposase